MKYLIPFSLILFILGCDNGGDAPANMPMVPEIETTEIDSISYNEALSGGKNIDDKGFLINEKGVCWDTVPSPTVNGERTNEGPGASTFESKLIGLKPETQYFARAYASSDQGVGYGNTLVFTTTKEPVVDIDGNTYPVVTIGAQTWMTKNLRTTRFANGDPIDNVIPGDDWKKYGQAMNPARCAYENNSNNVSNFGMLYNYYAISSHKGLCPEGWHIPSKLEFEELLSNYPTREEGKALKIEGTAPYWDFNNVSATNSSGFSAVGSGFRLSDIGFFALTEEGAHWSNTVKSGDNVYALILTSQSDSAIIDFSRLSNDLGLAVRCVED